MKKSRTNSGSNENFLKGLYKLQNPRKYLCDKNKIFYRSSWEKTFMRDLDTSPNIKGWCSECIVIPYYFNGRKHRYFPDFLIIDENNRHILVEIKPSRQTKKPVNSKTKSKRTMLYEQITYHKNLAKWEAAKLFCSKRDWEFKILTEKNLF